MIYSYIYNVYIYFSVFSDVTCDPLFFNSSRVVVSPYVHKYICICSNFLYLSLSRYLSMNVFAFYSLDYKHTRLSFSLVGIVRSGGSPDLVRCLLFDVDDIRLDKRMCQTSG